MREHEFRVFNKKTNEMYYLLEDRWSFGPYEGVRAVSWEDVFAERHEGLIPLEYTGLKDSKGKKIYEGDLIKFSDWEPKEVIYEGGDGLAGYRLKGTDLFMMGFESKEYEVVGNIYEEE